MTAAVACAGLYEKCARRSSVGRPNLVRARHSIHGWILLQFVTSLLFFDFLTLACALPYGLGDDVGNPRFSSRRKISDSGGESCH
jgi:hypothetical protein